MPIASKFGKEIGSDWFIFQKKKIFYACDTYVPDRVKKTMFKKISSKKTGVFGICGCSATGEFNPYAIHNCGLKFSGRLLGKYNALPKKASCDDQKFVAAQVKVEMWKFELKMINLFVLMFKKQPW